VRHVNNNDDDTVGEGEVRVDDNEQGRGWCGLLEDEVMTRTGWYGRATRLGRQDVDG
jgi:hypothetical protein